MADLNPTCNFKPQELNNVTEDLWQRFIPEYAGKQILCGQGLKFIKVLVTSTREKLKCMNPNYTKFKFPPIKRKLKFRKPQLAQCVSPENLVTNRCNFRQVYDAPL